MSIGWAYLLGRMVKGKKQNDDGGHSIHSVIRSHCPKTVFVGVRRVHDAVVSAIGKLNEDTARISKLWRSLL